MKNLSLEGFDTEHERSVNIEGIIKFCAVSVLWVLVLSGKASPADVRSVPKWKKAFLDHWDNSLIPSLLVETQIYMFSFHDAQWSTRK